MTADITIDGFDIVDDKFRTYVLPNAPLEELSYGHRWLEGPVWFADMQCLLVSDIPNNRVLRWIEQSGTSVFREPSGFANGHTRDREGRLISCLHHDRCITRIEIDGTVATLADHYNGKKLNSPNDVVVKSDGTIWFTDPTYGINTDYEGGKQESETPAAVYCYDPASNTMTMAIDDAEFPNGLCFSPDEKHLYLTVTGDQFAAAPEHSIRVYTVKDRKAVNGRFLYRADKGHADGIRCDVDGNIWAAAGDGIHCIDLSGKLLGKIKIPYPCSNLTFGGHDRSCLFICASHTLYAIYTNTRGAARP